MSDTVEAFSGQRVAAKRRYIDELARIDEAEQMVSASESGYLSRKEFSLHSGWSQRYTDELLAMERLPGVVHVGRRVRIPRRLVAHPEDILGARGGQ